MRYTHGDALEFLMERGMSQEEAENFLNSGSQVLYTTLEVPAAKVRETLEAISEIAVVTRPVRVQLMLSANRLQKMIHTAEATCGTLISDHSKLRKEALN
jgi:hypothetical protein